MTTGDSFRFNQMGSGSLQKGGYPSRQRPRVRVLSSPLFFLASFQSVRGPLCPAYPTRTLVFKQNHRIAGPSPRYVSLPLLLAGGFQGLECFSVILTLACPRRIDTRSIGVPALSSSTAKVSRNR